MHLLYMYNFNKLLTNYDLIDICAKLNINLIDVVNKDMLINLEPQRGCYIINLQDARDGGGTHWVALILDDYVSYFDSFLSTSSSAIYNVIKVLPVPAAPYRKRFLPSL